jgi:hypothetical protein
MATTFANGRSIAHKGDGGSQTSPAPDVCKTPSPGGPVPVPYVNMAQNSALDAGSSTVKIEGNPIALKSSNLSTSSGDEGGTAGGGIVSSKTKGKLTWAVASTDVKVEGEGVVRFLDTCLHNGNVSNAGGQPLRGETGLSYGGDAKCGKCGAPAGHPIKSTKESEAELKKVMKKAPPDRKGTGYMVGVLICRDPKTGKTVKLRAHSGKAPIPGFPMHPKDMPSGNTSQCAAQRLLNAARQMGLKPIAMTEALQGPSTKNYKSGRHATSCPVCVEELPAMLCPDPKQKKE